MTSDPQVKHRRKIVCCGCRRRVRARLTDGREIYPNRADLAALPFWRCDRCGNYVGCHHKTADPTRPLGNIPTRELREARRRVHEVLDPLWKSGAYRRGELYALLSKQFGFTFHVGELVTVEEATQVRAFIEKLAAERG